MAKNRILTGFAVCLICLLSSCGQRANLTQEQKRRDFEYLYQTLKQNYPYFGVGLRRTGIDWLAKHDEFVEKIQATNSDSAYIFALRDILRELGNGHADMSFVSYYEDYTSLYKKIADEYPRYKKWVATLEDRKARPRYWQRLLNGNRQEAKSNTAQTVVSPRVDYSDSLLVKEKTGIMSVTSFNLFNIEKDKPRIDSFLHKIRDYDHLIINIQNNGGGATRYWKENIVSRLIRDTVIYPQYTVIKDGSMNRHFYPAYVDSARVVAKEGTLQHIPVELLDGTFRLKVETDTIIPQNPVPFKGKIYLLVNSAVFSSAEGFAYFCKATNWATVAGVQTGGDGVGSDPVPFVLPESGIIVRYPALTGFNADGSLNFETCTIPDIIIESENSHERLNKLINGIRQEP
ncbi:MAG: hypothetical protein LBK94_04150 [Prevotellaceae bacterium]|jgi:hypothetical protein|nr:hypothetical protein [Prevotellaceae bacterium]